MRSIAPLLTAAGLFIMLAVLFACTYVGRDDALSQRFTWFSYVNGDDIPRSARPEPSIDIDSSTTASM